MMNRIIVFLSLCFLGISCTSTSNNVSNAETGFYYWKVATMPSNIVDKLNGLNTKYLYRKIMDIDWNIVNNRAEPISKLTNTSVEFKNLSNIDIIPVVFITNKTMINIDSAQINNLAKSVSNYIRGWEQDMNVTINEMQIDCDWTQSSKDNYFQFLSALKSLHPKRLLSITLRLYPYKYPKIMGVPPVDRAMLMCYNMGTIKDPNTHNSIIDSATLQSYLTHKVYPLKLDVALPTFGWHVWFRNNAYQGIIYDSAWQRLKPFTTAVKDNWSVLEEEQVLQQNYYRAGDKFRNEFPQAQDFKTYKKMVEKFVPNVERIIYFHLDIQNFNRYESVYSS